MSRYSLCTGFSGLIAVFICMMLLLRLFLTLSGTICIGIAAFLVLRAISLTANLFLLLIVFFFFKGSLLRT